MGPEERRTHSTSAFELPSASRTNKRWGGPLSYLRQQFQKGGLASATTWTHSAEQAIRKGAYPKANPTLASVSPSTHVCPVFAFRPLLRFDRCPCLPGIHTHAMPVFRPALIPTWRPRFARHLYSPGGHISTGAPFRLTPCPHDARASPGAPCFAWHSHFGRCSASTGARVHPAPIPIWRP